MSEPRESRAFEEFVLHPEEAFERLRQSARPETLVRADGREIVVMDAAAFDSLVEPPIDPVEEAEVIRIVKERIASFEAGEKTYSVDEAFAALQNRAAL